MGDGPATVAREEIAIIGMAGRFPGARDIDAFWDNLRDGVESIRAFTQEELAASGVGKDTQRDPEFVNAGAVMEDADCFDAEFFGMSAREAETTDPQHRVFLECAWAALEHAGCDTLRYDGLIGIFGGVGPNTYFQENLITHRHLLDMLGRYPVMIGNEPQYCVTRVAFKLDLRGPAISVHTACSTSGVAIHLACQSLLTGECDMALAGGARIQAPLYSGYVYQEDGIPSPDGHCRAFDARAQGTVIASGAAIVVLKRLSDAQRDGDTIHAVIKGSAINNDGSAKAGFTAPSVQGQAEVIREALAVADVSPEDISYVEAHGTGTALGDPIEIAALTRAFGRNTTKRQFCAIGSVKTNIGHLDAAAGAAGVIKTVLAMTHRQIPPSLHFETPNPQIDFANSPFRVCDRLVDWNPTNGVRRAGVSSFGLGGTNAHIVLEEAPADKPPAQSSSHELLVLSAKTEPALTEQARLLGEYLRASPDVALSNVAHTLQVGRTQFEHRQMLVASTTREAAEILVNEDRRRSVIQRAESSRGDVVFMFAGGGAQYVNMARDLYQETPDFRDIIDHCSTLVEPRIGLDLRSVLYPDHSTHENATAMERPSIALPALFAVEYALAKQWMKLGVRPAAMIGHSMGEYTAACIAGTLTLSDALGLVTVRGQLFERLSEGAMLSVPLTAVDVERYLVEGVSIAAVNKPDACVVSGPTPAIERMHATFAQRGLESRLLHISVAAHSPLVEPILDEFRAFVRSIRLSPPQLPWVSNVTGTWVEETEATDPEYWVRHLRSTVRFSDGLRTIMDASSYIMLEVGPGQTLSTFARQHPSRGKDRPVVSSLRHPNESAHDVAFMLGAMGRLWLTGVEVDWSGHRNEESRRRIPLPTYPFARKRRWIDPATSDTGEDADRASISPSGGPVHSTDPAYESGVGDAAASSSTASEPPQNGVAREIIRILHELSGIDPEEIDVNRSFLELGFDSLFLTQASAAFHRAFQVRTTFRQLFDEAPTVTALAAFIEANLPPSERAPVARPAPDAAEVHRQQSTVETIPNPPSASGGGRGPWKPIDKNKGAGFSPRQQAHIEQLTERLIARTGGSKRLTQANRPHLADPRTVAGFRLPWKELVYPIVVDRSAGSRVWDIDGNEFIDLTMGFGVSLFGHSPPFIIDAVTEQLSKGIEIGPQTPLAGEVAGLVCEFTGMERAAFCNTGSEAVLAAIRVARTVTGRTRVATFAGDYHGIFDEMLVKGVTVGGQRRSIPVAPGIPPHAVDEVLVLTYDDPESLDILRSQAHELAAILVEPVQSRHPDLQPRKFLKALRHLATETDVPLIFDEMITGFRSHPGGAQAVFDVRADIATYGKVLGGGFPIGVVAGRRRYLDALDGGMWSFGDASMPEVGVTWFAGTFVRHPVALAAARAALLHMKAEGASLQRDLNARTTRFVGELNGHFEHYGIPIHLEHFSSLFLIVFESHQELSSLFYQHLRDNGIHITENRAAFLSTAHSDEDLERIQEAFEASAHALCDSGFLPSRGGADAAAAVAPQAASGAEVPLTEGQEEIWLASCVSDDANCAFNLCNTLALRGYLDVEKFTTAVELLAQRHEALRTTIHGESGTQRIAGSADLRTAVVDLSGLDEQDRQAQVEAVRQQAVSRPFDLVHGPLVRSTLLKLADDEHLYLLTVHHVICDGWSSGTLFRDLGEMYSSLVEGRAPRLPTVLQLSDYAQQAHLSAETEGPSSISYWLDQLGASPPVIDLPTDRPRPKFKTFRAQRVERVLEPRLVEELERAAKTHACTLFTLLVAGFNTLVLRLTGQSESVLGISVAGQPAAGDLNLVGHCVALLPLKIGLDRSGSVTDYITGVRRQILEAFDYQAVTFGSILKHLTLRRDSSRNPLVSVVFNMDSSMQGLRFAGLEAEAGSSPRAFENFEMFVNVVRANGTATVECTFNSDLFDAATIERHLAAFEVLLAGLAADGDATVEQLPILSSDITRQLAAWNATAQPYRAESTIHGLVHEQAVRTPDAVALRCGQTTLTYGQLDAQADRLAHYLRSLGVGPESLVGICLDRSPAMLVSILAAMKAGGAYVPLDPAYPHSRIAFILEDSHAQVLITSEAYRDTHADSAATVVCIDSDWDSTVPGQPQSPMRSVSSSSLAYVIYTSGSTGRPKGVVIEHRSTVALIDWALTVFSPEELSGVVASTSICFDLSVFEMFVPLASGGTVILVDDILELATLPSDMAVTLINTIPSALAELLRSEEPLPPSIRTINLAGEPLSVSLVREAYAKTSASKVYDLYGPSEDTTYSTYALRRPDAPATIGRPIANTQVYILDGNMAVVPIGVAGELYLAGAGLARGYLGRPELTNERFIANPFADQDGERMYRTGDLARYRPDGNIEFLGRADDQVKFRGFRIELGEIEAVLVAHPAVKEVVAMIRNDRPDDPRLVAYVVWQHDRPGTIEEVRRYMETKLPSFMIPQHIIELGQLPMTPNGKTDRHALPAPEGDRRLEGSSDPKTETEKAVARIWQDVLGAAKVGARDDFFTIGGHSLLAMRVVSRIREQFAVSLSLRVMFEAPTVEALACKIDMVTNTPSDDREEFRL